MASKNTAQIVSVVIVTAVITFILAFLFLKYLPESQDNKLVSDYKAAIYGSTLCQYKCPLTPQSVQNKTEYLPDPVCVKNCTDKFKAALARADDIPKNKLLADRLMDDMSMGINGCRTSALDSTKTKMNSTMFLGCSIEKLEGLKSKYDYLN